MGAQRIELRSKTSIEDQVAHFGDRASDQSRVEFEFQCDVATRSLGKGTLQSFLASLIEGTGTGDKGSHATFIFIDELTEFIGNFVQRNQSALIHEIEDEVAKQR